jgi:hypothetical protein
MRTPEQTFETYAKPTDIQPNPESHIVTYRPEINLGNVALVTARTRQEIIEAKKADDDYEDMLNDRFRPETD